MPQPEARQKLSIAFSLHQSGRLAQAEIVYREILKQHPDDALALHYLGALRASLGQFNEARSLIARSLEIQPSNIQFFENYAAILYQAGDHESALQICDKGLHLNSASVALLYISAIVHYKLKQFDESLSQFDALLSRQPEHLAAINERGSVLAEMGEIRRGKHGFSKSTGACP
jgi:protein O-GlcNAc transferase